MALSVKDPEADRLAREVVARTGETHTTAVIVALRERLARLRGRSRRKRLRDELREIAQRCAQLPTLDDRSVEELVPLTSEACRADGARCLGTGGAAAR